jgi:hypothetical protein
VVGCSCVVVKVKISFIVLNFISFHFTDCLSKGFMFFCWLHYRILGRTLKLLMSFNSMSRPTKSLWIPILFGFIWSLWRNFDCILFFLYRCSWNICCNISNIMMFLSVTIFSVSIGYVWIALEMPSFYSEWDAICPSDSMRGTICDCISF